MKALLTIRVAVSLFFLSVGALLFAQDATAKEIISGAWSQWKVYRKKPNFPTVNR